MRNLRSLFCASISIILVDVISLSCYVHLSNFYVLLLWNVCSLYLQSLFYGEQYVTIWMKMRYVLLFWTSCFNKNDNLQLLFYAPGSMISINVLLIILPCLFSHLTFLKVANWRFMDVSSCFHILEWLANIPFLVLKVDHSPIQPKKLFLVGLGNNWCKDHEKQVHQPTTYNVANILSDLKHKWVISNV